ncbi:YnhF family membrane protein [Pantoea sp. 1.19]|nr:YnhF family membrane protein [Pantoea sp. 1.19]
MMSTELRLALGMTVFALLIIITFSFTAVLH